MRGKVFVVLSLTVFVAAVPQPARFDLRQTGTYNLHVNLRDGQVFAMVKDTLVSAPIRNFAVTLKGPIAPQTTESPRADTRPGSQSQPPRNVAASNSKTPAAEISPNLKIPQVPIISPNEKIPSADIPTSIQTPIGTSSKTPSIQIYPNLKVPLTGISHDEPHIHVAPTRQPNVAPVTNNRRQNNKVASQSINQQANQLASSSPLPLPTTEKMTLSPLPSLPPSIIAALTDQRTTNQRIQALPDEINEIHKIKTSYVIL